MNDEQEKAIQPTGNKLLPIADPEQAKEAYQAYLELCQSVLVPYDKRMVDDNGVVRQESDYARITQRKKVEGRWITEYVDAPKKSAWRKLARFYGVSTEILDKQRIEDEDGVVTWHYSVRAWEGNVSTTGEGACSTNEKGKERTEHEAKGTSHTRAKNRAISDLIGFGQVSAEEMIPEAPRKQVDAEVKVKPKNKKKKKAPSPKETPQADPDEERVKETLTANDLSLDGLSIYKYGKEVRVTPTLEFPPERFDEYNEVITRLLSAKWANDTRWEVPC